MQQSPDLNFIEIISKEVIPFTSFIRNICDQHKIPYAMSFCTYSDGREWKEAHSYYVPGNEKTPAFYQAMMALIENPELTEDVLLAARRLAQLKALKSTNGN